uniref:Kazal-like domain-containing protein n=1 Tax=Callorhinchus milii TaxID=7868 RepID=A0A4W3H375_CALMI
ALLSSSSSSVLLLLSSSLSPPSSVLSLSSSLSSLLLFYFIVLDELCGTNNVTYKNHCFLCVAIRDTQKRIKIKNHGSCKTGTTARTE